MDTRTGKIHEIENEKQKVELEARLNGTLTLLSNRENEILSRVTEQDRPLELALMRFIEERKRLDAPYGLAIQNAFRLGYQAAVKDRE